MEKEDTNGLMAQYIKANIKMAKDVELEKWFIKTEIYLKVNGKMVKSMVVGNLSHKNNIFLECGKRVN